MSERVRAGLWVLGVVRNPWSFLAGVQLERKMWCFGDAYDLN